MSYDAIARRKGCMGSWSDCEAWRGGVFARPRWRGKMYSQDGLAAAAGGSLIATIGQQRPIARKSGVRRCHQLRNHTERCGKISDSCPRKSQSNQKFKRSLQAYQYVKYQSLRPTSSQVDSLISVKVMAFERNSLGDFCPLQFLLSSKLRSHVIQMRRL